MPKNKFQEVIFTIIMVFVMVYAMICYNIVLNTGTMTNETFLLAFHENEANQRTGIKNLPEERHREIHCCCLKPCRDNLAYRCMFDQHSGCKAHARAHKCYRYCRNCKYQVERIISSHIHNTKCNLLCKTTDDKEIKNKCNRSHEC